MRCTLALFCVVAWLTSCSPLANLSQSANSTAAYAHAAARESTALLYVSDTLNNDVDVYSYPHGKLVQTLSGLFENPQGLCSDNAGNVFIADPIGFEVLEYAHGGKVPVATFFDRPYAPEGCAVDPASGNLAVTEGQFVAIYAKATGKPKRYKLPHINAAAFCGYDDQGDLFVDGGSYYYYLFELDELVAGAKRFTTLSVSQTIGQAGGVQWDGTYVAVGDVSTGTVYRFAVQNGKTTLEGSTQLGDSNNVNQFWIDGGKVIGPNNGSIDVMVWKYPEGGNPIRRIPNPRPGRHRPFGATVSD
jgi:hypothetical protein